MSTFGQPTPNARADQATVDKDNPTPEQIAAAEGGPNDTGEQSIPATDPQHPTELLDEDAGEQHDRHVASTELPVGDVTPPETQADTSEAEDAKEKIVPGAGVGPDPAGVVRNDHGRVAYAPPGSLDAAFNGVQEDASGHVDSVGTDNSARSNSRV
jgi:hypothetical protein